VAAVAVLAASATALGVGVGTASAKSGGDAHFNQKGTFDYTDPALGYLQVFWQITQATCVKLVNYPDTTGAAALQLKPEAASAFAITNGGKTYTFTVPANKYTFYPKGGGVTAATFKAVVERLADPKMNMPAPAYLTEIAGAQARIDGKASSVSGVQVHGNKIVFNLVAPTGDFLSRLALSFFCAVPANTPHNPNGETSVPMAGPYYFKSVVPNKQVVIAKNPNYKGSRPRNFNSFTWTEGQDQTATEEQIQKNQIDWAVDGTPPADNASLWSHFSCGLSGATCVRPLSHC